MCVHVITVTWWSHDILYNDVICSSINIICASSFSYDLFLFYETISFSYLYYDHPISDYWLCLALHHDTLWYEDIVRKSLKSVISFISFWKSLPDTFFLFLLVLVRYSSSYLITSASSSLCFRALLPKS